MSAVRRVTPHLMSLACPGALRDLQGWLIWRMEHQAGEVKPRKVPYYAQGGRRHGAQGRPEDRARLVTFQAARAAAARLGFDGVGLALMPEWGVVALDFDNCVGPLGLDPVVEQLVTGTYAEYSPSGRGVRAFFQGQLGNGKSHDGPFGFEVFSSVGFVTFTGSVLEVCGLTGDEDTVAPVTAELLAMCAQRLRSAPVDAPGGQPLGLTPERMAEALDVLPADLDYDRWLQVGMALHHETAGRGFRIWDEWSSRSPKYGGATYGMARWKSFGEGGGRVVTARTLVHMANMAGAHIPLAEVGADDFQDLGGSGSGDDQVQAAPPEYSEAGIADAFVTSLDGRARFVTKQGVWLFWDGRRWVDDEVRSSLDRVREFCRGVAQVALRDPALGTQGRTIARTVESTRFAKGVELFASVDARVAASPDQFDAQTWVLNTPDGVVDLRTGLLTASRPEQGMRMMTAVAPGGACPRFEQFMLDICQGDVELVRFLQVGLGYTLTGDTTMHSLLFLFGHGRNGKSTLIQLVQEMAGGYAKRIPSETLMSDTKAGRHPTEIANLKGVRLAWSSEVEEGAFFSDARIKDLTGEDTLTGRFMHKDNFVFRRTHNLVLMGNHRPRLKSVDQAIRSRIKLVPFRANFAGREDRSLPTALAGEAGGVLAWLIEGAQAWHKTRGLPACRAVQAASDEYFAAQSTVAMWVTECCVEKQGSKMAAGNAYDSYRAWKAARGENALSMMQFSEQLLPMFGRRILDGRRYFTDVELAEKSELV